MPGRLEDDLRTYDCLRQDLDLRSRSSVNDRVADLPDTRGPLNQKVTRFGWSAQFKKKE